jgi:probable F420-dependent oxidoreductase
MKIGVVFPQTEFVSDPIAIRDYAQTVEGLGFSHVLAYDHVVGVNPNRPGGWTGPYTYESAFQEPLIMFSYMAACTGKLEFTTGVIILPQRQTVLFAKQAATLDVLSGGRLRVGIGLGWNEVEYVALDENFHTRGRRLEEQVKLLHELWTKPLVNFKGRWHYIPDAGINPLPVQRPIPIWFGGHSEAQLGRAANLGDGWMPNSRTVHDARSSLDELNRCLMVAGRSRESFGIEARTHYLDGKPETWVSVADEWQSVGATHLSFNTMGNGFTTPDAHLAAIRAYAKAMFSR